MEKHKYHFCFYITEYGFIAWQHIPLCLSKYRQTCLLVDYDEIDNVKEAIWAMDLGIV